MAQLATLPFVGCASDLFGRRLGLSLAIIGIGADCAALALVGLHGGATGLLFGAHVASGVCGQLYLFLAVVFAAVADGTSDVERAACFGVLEASACLGALLGPLASGPSRLLNPSSL